MLSWTTVGLRFDDASDELSFCRTHTRARIACGVITTIYFLGQLLIMFADVLSAGERRFRI